MALVSFVDALKGRYGAPDDTQYAADAFLVGDSTRKKNKTWEMVGMEKTRQKQAQHSKLVSVVLRDCAVNIAQHTPTEIEEQQLLRLQELDLSQNVSLTLVEIDEIVQRLPSLNHLQLSGVPLLKTTIEVPVEWNRLKKLVLNNTGFADLGQIASMLHVPLLEELHLDNNGIECLLEGSIAGSQWSLPKVTSLSLGGNKFASWKGSGLNAALYHCFPSLQKLFLTRNELPDLTEDDVPHVEFLQRLTLLCLNENKNMTSPSNLVLIRKLCPLLETFRITYQYIFPALNETLARMLVVASLPSVTMLNRAQVRPKERTDSELFYVQRGLSEEDITKRDAMFPFTAELRDKHKDVVLALIREGETASSGAHIMLDLRLRCDGFADTNKTVPSSLSVGKLKALVRSVFGVDVNNVALSYWSGDTAFAAPPTPLDNELHSLAYFGVGNGAIIKVQDLSLR